MFHKRKVSWIPLILLGAILGGMGTSIAIAGGSINPPGSGPIQAAYSKSDGGLRLVNGPGDVKNSEAYLTWNQVGATGAAGPGYGIQYYTVIS